MIGRGTRLCHDLYGPGDNVLGLDLGPLYFILGAIVLFFLTITALYEWDNRQEAPTQRAQRLIQEERERLKDIQTRLDAAYRELRSSVNRIIKK